MASIATMPRPRPITAVLCAAIAVPALLAGCGGDDPPKPSISGESSLSLIATLQEIEDNVEVGSCQVAAEKVDEFIAELDELPSDVNEEVKDALERGAVSLRDLVEDPDECAREETTTTEETTTEEETTTTDEETTTEETTTQETTTTTPTIPTTPTTPGSGGGGVAPGDGL